ncbi:Lrp/AsnC family transcriptional regulator [Subtercola vilae]|uniref:Lrp/AsnC family transcriptional regulator n=1 Tax=Subtercola vilae TaxID=2056433 RepID=UPI001F3F0010|nr:Lrp/AsnC family transcriptional regulator [Subtercola vilae]
MLDTLDDLDRRIVVAMQNDGRASWRAIAEVVDSSTATVARRGQHLISAGVIKVAVVPSLGATGDVSTFLIRITCQPGMQILVAAELVTHADVRFVTIVTGGYDIFAELAVSGGATHYPQLVEELQSITGIERWRSDLIMHIYKVSFDWGRQLFADTLRLPAVEHPADTRTAGTPGTPSTTDLQIVEPTPCSPTHFDSADWKILDLLRDDGRVTFQAIADSLGMNESSVRRRFERLKAAECIDILTLVPAPALGMGAETLMTVKVSPARMDAVARELAQHPAVRYLAATLDENALFCEIIMPSTNDLYTFITSTLSQLDGVEGWTASMELLFLKRGFIETPWWRGQVSYPELGAAASA